MAETISAAEIPHPPGLNTAMTLNWERQGMGGPVPESLIRELLQANAIRDWVWFGAHNELTAEEREVVACVLDWPAAHPMRALIEPAVRAILSGDKGTAQASAKALFRDKGGQPPGVSLR